MIADDDESAVSHFKEMIRNSTTEHQDSLNHAQEFVNQETPSSPRGHKSPKPKRGMSVSPEQCRPDDWLGSPSSTQRKSYKVKNILPNVSPLNRDAESGQDKNQNGTRVKSSSKTKSATMPIGASSMYSMYKPPLSPPIPSPPEGVTRHTLGGSSSHHKATSSYNKPVDDNKVLPDAEKYRDILRASLHEEADDESKRSQKLLGQEAPQSPRGHKSHKHGWGAPVSPEQFRPDGWLGSPSSAKRKSYKIKSPAGITTPVFPDMKDEIEKGSMPSLSTAVPVPVPVPASAVLTPPAAISPKHPITNNSAKKKAKTPFKSVSMPVRPGLTPKASHKSPHGSTVRTSQVVDRTKFLESFSKFEGFEEINAIPSAFAVSSPLPQQSEIGSPSGRNFKVSKEARAKSELLQNSSILGLESSSTHTPVPRRDLTTLDNAISRLRRVAGIGKTATGHMNNSDLQASDIMRMLKHVEHNKEESTDIEGSRSFLSIFNGLRKNRILESRIEPEELNAVQEIMKDLDDMVGQLEYQEPSRMEMEVCARILHQIAPHNHRSAGMIQDVIGRLRKVSRELPSKHQSSTMEMAERLEGFGSQMAKREQEELANIIRNIDDDELDAAASDGGTDKLTCVLGVLDHMGVSQGFSDRDMLGTMVSSSGLDTSPICNSPRGREATISPRQEAKRNFNISNDARAKSIAVSSLLLEHSHHSQNSEQDELHMVIAKLKKVVITKKDSSADKSEQQASEIMQIMTHLRNTGITTKGAQELYGMIDDLREKGVISSNLGPNRKEEIGKCIEELENIRKKINQREYSHGEVAAVIKNLRKLTPTSAGAVDILQQSIARLTKVSMQVYEKEQKETEDVITRLQAVLNSMMEGEEAQLIEIIRKLDGESEHGEEIGNLVRVLDGLDKAAESRSVPESTEEDKKKESAALAKARMTPEDADFLIYALLKLKKAKMTHREAVTVASIIRNLKRFGTTEEEETSDEAIAKIAKQVKSKRKAKGITKVLQGLRRLNLNDPERAALAEIVRGLGAGRKGIFRDEIVDAVSKLRKIQMNKREATEVSGIMFNLRKVLRPDYDINQSREMSALCKIMTAEQAEVVASVFESLSQLDLSDKEIDDVARIVAELGVGTLDSDEHQLISVQYVDGSPLMVLHIPEGEDWASKIGDLGISGFVKKQKTYPSREFRFWIELDSEDQNSDEFARLGDSDFEEASDDEDSDAEDRVNKNCKRSPNNSPKSSPKSTPATTPKQSHKKFHHYGAGQEGAEVLDKNMSEEEREKRIRFTNKHQWRFKKHNQTVVSEKRWRFEEDFNVDEVIWSPLSREQYDRRKTVGTSILKSMDKFAPLDDMVLDEFVEKSPNLKKKKAKAKIKRVSKQGT